MLNGLRKFVGNYLFNYCVIPPADKNPKRLISFKTDYGHAEYFDDFFSRPESEFIAASELCEGTTILDLGGGTGKLSFELALKGKDVTLVDTSGSMIERARVRRNALLHRDRASFEIERQDLRTLSLSHLSDGAYLMGCPLGHLADPEEIREALTTIRSYLLPSSVLYLEEYHLPFWQNTWEWKKNRWRYLADLPHGGTKIRIWRRTSSGPTKHQFRLEHALRSRKARYYAHLDTTLQIFPQSSWRKWLFQAGFRVEAEWGDWKRNSLNLTSQCFILKAVTQ